MGMKALLRRQGTSVTSSLGKLPDYKVYVLSVRQKWACLLASGIGLYCIGYVFFHSFWFALVMTGGAAFIPKYWSQYLLSRRRDALSLNFKQALYSLSSSLVAGRSVENGFRDAIEDLRLLYPGGDNDLMMELGIICTRLEYGQPIEVALQDFSDRAGSEDIGNFADVFTTCKRSGGDLVEIIRRTSAIISEKLEISQEIGVMIAQKRFESKVMMVSPLFFLVFMDMSSPDYMSPMHSGIGLVISAVALLVFALCAWLMMKIMDIKV
ncbi:pilus assembly protein TadB [Paenibacillus anaericanus]|uniref:Pilus assembly protein TadB n=1 Tax=Paenibacillus anaericanus TaxID=170367 RepID=A0A433Y9Q0_9BACL|nr:type II secretion system F family protein [Paenibacillus anaericanus]RUT46622.1 pilus assembly protein TadB [Paenibacillus anaericanus]